MRRDGCEPSASRKAPHCRAVGWAWLSLDDKHQLSIENKSKASRPVDGWKNHDSRHRRFGACLLLEIPERPSRFRCRFLQGDFLGLGECAISKKLEAVNRTQRIAEKRHMKNAILLICVWLMGSVAGAYGDQVPVIETSAATQEPDGRILNSKPWAALPNFESLDDFGRNYFPREVYEEARTQKEFDVLEITYPATGSPCAEC